MFYSVNAGDKLNGLESIHQDKILEIDTGCSENETKQDSKRSFASSSSSYRSSYQSTSSSARSFHRSGQSNPQIQLGRKLLDQAIYDYQTGTVTFDGIESDPFKGYNWVCIQCQQVMNLYLPSLFFFKHLYRSLII